jgi:hypothetical protein
VARRSRRLDREALRQSAQETVGSSSCRHCAVDVRIGTRDDVRPPRELVVVVKQLLYIERDTMRCVNGGPVTAVARSTSSWALTTSASPVSPARRSPVHAATSLSEELGSPQSVIANDGSQL